MGCSGRWSNEAASSPLHETHVKPAAVRFDAATADGQPQAEARSLDAELRERSKDLLHFPLWETAAFVLDGDQDAVGH
jgi:hypothetical protein